MTLRQATPSDVDALLQLMEQTPALPRWRPEDLALSTEEMDGSPALRRHALLLEREHGEEFAPSASQQEELRPAGNLIGFALYALVLDEAELEMLVVRDDLRRSGLGSMLLQSVVTALEARGATLLRLEVRAGNAAAVALYKAAGFHEAGLRPHYYCNPAEDALLLERRLQA